jgi:hypothetical protein
LRSNSARAAGRGDRQGHPRSAAFGGHNLRVFLKSTISILLLVFALVGLAFGAGPGFRSKHLMDDHFEKHGKEFGPITERQYLQLAQQLRDTRAGVNVIESRREDGVISKFDRRHGYFGAYDPDGTIRTFFIPADGVRYFERQARRDGPN